MSLRRIALLLATHTAVGAAGFAGGIYVLPILIAPDAPTVDAVRSASAGATFTGTFKRDLQDSDALHWGEGTVSVGPTAVTLMGRLAPGPDYKLYLSPDFVETESAFKQLKPKMLRIGDVKTFQNFVVPLPPGTDLARFNTVVVWCETFNEFISAARFR